jgi:hypothetical protein
VIWNNQKFNWRLFFILWFMVVIGVLGVIPYTLTLQTEQIAKVKLPISLEQLILIQVLANTILLGIVTGLGLLLAHKIGLGLPFLDAITRKQHIHTSFRPVLFISIIIGVLSGIIIVALDVWVFDLDKTGVIIPEHIKPPAWQGFLASFYGGIIEEISLRLFLFSLLAWLASFIIKSERIKPKGRVLWTVNVITAVIFGLGHLPITIALGLPLDAFIVSRAIVLNGIGGLAFGWLYWTYGLESAMVAHFSADIVLHVLFAF